MTDKKETWRVEEHEECFTKRWIRYDREGKAVGVTIIMKNASIQLIEALKEAFEKTEGKFIK